MLKKIKVIFTNVIIFLTVITIYFIIKVVSTFSINDLNLFILALSIYLTNYCLVFISLTSLFFYFLIRIISKIFLEPQLRTTFLVLNAIIIIFFLNILMAITALKNENSKFLVVVFISNLSLIYALIKVSEEYSQKIKNL